MKAAAVQRAHGAYVGAFIDELIRSGVRDLCFAPGSRSTPLVMMASRRPELTLWSHIDERASAFFALGIAKAEGRPVAIVSTSGTGAANFTPAVVEAYYARVPLLVLTADRPHELRDRGAAQTIDQIGLYGEHVKWFVDVAPSSDDPALVRYIRTTACRAVATASGAPAGPVHINFPFREPLIPVTEEPAEEVGPSVSPAARVSDETGGRTEPYTAETEPATGGTDSYGGGTDPYTGGTEPYTSVWRGRLAPFPAQVESMAAELRSARRGLIVCGPQSDPAFPEAVTRLAHQLQWPVLADPLSLVRCGPHRRSLVIDAFDAMIRDEHFASSHAPDVVLHFGAMPISKPLMLYLERHRHSRHIAVDEAEGWRDPYELASLFVHADPTVWCDALADALSRAAPSGGEGDEPSPRTAEWTEAWIRAGATAREAMDRAVRDMEGDFLFEGRVFTELSNLLPTDSALFVGNSMPVRYLDTFFPTSGRPIHFLGNRGVNGIDGVISSALGVAAARGRADRHPVVLVIGDLSFYHDLNGLLAAKLHGLDALIVLINNDGGGIFSFLPQAEEHDTFEELFATPIGLDYRPVVEMYGGRFIPALTWDEFRRGVQVGLQSKGITVVEVRTSREHNVAQHRAVWQAVSQALHRAGRDERS